MSGWGSFDRGASPASRPSGAPRAKNTNKTAAVQGPAREGNHLAIMMIIAPSTRVATCAWRRGPDSSPRHREW